MSNLRRGADGAGDFGLPYEAGGSAFASTVFAFSAPAAGVRTSKGSASTAFAFSAPASGFSAVPGEGFASTVFTFDAPASGARIVKGAASTVFAFSAPIDVVPKPAALWKFNESESPALSGGISSIALAEYGSNVTWGEPALYVGGDTTVKIGPGSSSGLNSQTPRTPFLTSAEVSVGIWFKQDSTSFGYWGLDLLGVDQCGISVLGWYDYELEVYGQSDGYEWDFYLVAPDIYHDDVAHALVVVVDATEARMYIDGTLVDTDTRSLTPPPGPPTPPGTWTWGDPGSEQLDTFLLYSTSSHSSTFADLYVVDDVLSPGEITEFSTAGPPSLAPNQPAVAGSISTTFAFDAPIVVGDLIGTLRTTTSLNPGEVGVTAGPSASFSHTVVSGTVTVTGTDPILTRDYAYRGLYTISPTATVPRSFADGGDWVILASLDDFQLRLRREGGTVYQIRADFVTAAAQPTWVTGQLRFDNNVTHTIGLGVVRYHTSGAITMWRSDDRWATWMPIPLSTNTLVPGLLPDAAGASIRLLSGDLSDGPWVAIFRAQWGGT
jgi:hypothetical protein